MAARTTSPKQRVLSLAATLSPAERLEVAVELLEASAAAPASDDWDHAWAEEVRRRMRRLSRGDVRTIPWERVRSSLDARLRAMRPTR